MPASTLAQVTKAGPNSPPPGVTMETVLQGREIFEGSGLCTTCHGQTAEGAIGPDLTDGDWLQAKGSYLAILQVVLNGVTEESSTTGTAMPARGDTNIEDAAIQSVAAYVWKISHPGARDSLPLGVTPQMVTRGEQVFLGSGGCALCHGADATGLLGPDLTDDVWFDAKGRYSTIGQIITKHISEITSTGGVAMPPKGGPGLSEDEIQKVAAYVWFLSHR